MRAGELRDERQWMVEDEQESRDSERTGDGKFRVTGKMLSAIILFAFHVEKADLT